MPLFKGPTSKGMEGNGRGGRKCKGEGRGEVEGGIWPTQKFWCGAPYEGGSWRRVEGPKARAPEHRNVEGRALIKVLFPKVLIRGSAAEFYFRNFACDVVYFGAILTLLV